MTKPVANTAQLDSVKTTPLSCKKVETEKNKSEKKSVVEATKSADDKSPKVKSSNGKPDDTKKFSETTDQAKQITITATTTANVIANSSVTATSSKKIPETRRKNADDQPKKSVEANTRTCVDGAVVPVGGNPGNPGNPGASNDPVVPDENRLLSLAQRGEWNGLDQLLRSVEQRPTPQQLNACEPETGVTAAMLAARDNRLVICERLFDLGAEVNARTMVGRLASIGQWSDTIVCLSINTFHDRTV